MRVSAILIAALLVLIAAGCGGSSGSESNSSNGGSTASSSESKGEEGTKGGEEGTTGGEETSGEESGGEETASEEAGGETASGAPLTKKEFVKQAEAICTKIPATYSEKLKALEAEAKKKGKKPTTSETNLKAAVPADYAALEEFEALTPPKGEEQQVEAIVASLEKAAKGLEANPEAPLTGAKSPYAEWQKLTGAYGLKSCSAL